MGEREPLQLSRYYIIPPSQRTKSSLLLRLIGKYSGYPDANLYAVKL